MNLARARVMVRTTLAETINALIDTGIRLGDFRDGNER